MLRVSQSFLSRISATGTHQIKRRLAASAQVKVEEGRPETQHAPKNYSFIANIFRGELEASQLFPFPNVLNEEQREHIGSFIDPVTKFMTEVNDAAKNDDRGCLDEVTANGFWDLGAFALQVPAEMGGLGLNNTQYARMCELMGAYDLGAGIVLGAHQSIGFKGILLFGTKEQKEKYLPQVSTGKVLAAFCLTEPSSGSDAGSIRCKAVLSPDKKHYILNGSKIWISNGGVADILTVFAQTEVEDPKTGNKRDKVTAFIVERGFGGVTSGPAEAKMGIKASNTSEIFFEDVKIPVENVIGEVGNGFKVAMSILNNGRFGMSGTLAGTMRACIEKATEHATQRVQFGQKISEYKGVQEKLARMSMLQYAAQSMAYMISGNMDSGSVDYHLEAAISKVFASEAAWNVCDESIQILGGMGYMKAAGLERVMRDLRIFRIFEGTNDILRLFVALTGIQYAGSHLKELQRAFKNPAANLGLIFQESSRRAIRSLGFGGIDLSGHVHPKLQPAAKDVAECITLFGQSVEALLIKYNKNIIHEQFLLNRLADAAIDIYAMSVVLSRVSQSLKQELPTADHEMLVAECWAVEGSERVKNNLKKTNSTAFLEMYGKMSQQSKNICEAGGIVHTNPLQIS
ncbi:very long-chain specific acyl-CoA dehydrogenase, mitochondrial [Sergentomyia squamirostris]